MTIVQRARPATVAVRAAERRLRLRWLACWLVLVLVAAFTCWSALAWWHAGHDDAVSLAAARDRALAAGTREVAALHTVDYRHVNVGLDRWLVDTTGPLHQELQRTLATSRTKLAQAKASTSGSVDAAAITALDQHAGTATLIASVTVRVVRDGGAPTTERNRYRAAMACTTSGWKLSALTAIPAG